MSQCSSLLRVGPALFTTQHVSLQITGDDSHSPVQPRYILEARRGGNTNLRQPPPPSFPIRNNQMTAPGVVRAQRRLQINFLLSAARRRGPQRRAGLSRKHLHVLLRGVTMLLRPDGIRAPTSWLGWLFSAPVRPVCPLVPPSLPDDDNKLEKSIKLVALCPSSPPLTHTFTHSLSHYSLCSRSNPTTLIMQDQQFLRSKPMKL